MDTQSTHNAGATIGAYEVATRRVLVAVHAHLRGEGTTPLYLVTGLAHGSDATAVLAAGAAELCAVGCGDRLLAGAGDDIARLWRDTLRRGLTPIVRRALAARRAILLDGIEALCGEPFAQSEVARLIVPERLVVLAGRDHPRHIAAWSPLLAAQLTTATTLCLHDGPCFIDEDVRAIVDLVAEYYGLTRATLLSPRRTETVAHARQMAMALFRERGLTYDAVGRILGRDHATAMYGHARIRRLSASESGVRDNLARLRRRISAA